MQWMVPLNRLDDFQRHILDRCVQLRDGRLWIQGFAGSGKTVILVHAIREALELNPGMSASVVVYTHALKDLVQTGLPAHLQHIPVTTYHHFLRNPRTYDIIVVDEVQDLERDVLEKLKSYTKRLIVAGDGDQSIYGGRVKPAEIESILAPEKHRLEVLYRITQTLKELVKSILPHSHIESARIGRVVANVDVRLGKAKDISKEVAWVWREASKYCRQGDPVAVLLPKRKLINRFIDHACDHLGKPKPSYTQTVRKEIDYHQVNDHLDNHGINLRYLGSDFGRLTESDERPIIYLMTYHSAKGLDFETVFLPHLDHSMEFWNDDDNLSRRLFFVAVTRSRRNLFMSHHSHEPHPYIKAMPQNNLKKFDIVDASHSTNDDTEYF